MGKDARARIEPFPQPIATATYIEASELAYQQALLQRIRTEQQQHQALVNYWMGYLAQKYGLSQQDRVEEDGRIVRVPTTEAK